MSDINDKAEAEEAAHYEEKMAEQYEAEIERLKRAAAYQNKYIEELEAIRERGCDEMKRLREAIEQMADELQGERWDNDLKDAEIERLQRDLDYWVAQAQRVDAERRKLEEALDD